MAISGIDSIQEMLDGFAPESLSAPLFLELLSCSGGCTNGPGMTNAAPGVTRRARLTGYAQYADAVLDDATLSKTPFVAVEFPASHIPPNEHTEEEITDALRSVGKFTIHDRLNCSSCGYDSCRDFALALLAHRAEKSMCASYMRNLASKKANGLIRAIPNGIVIVNKHLAIVECNEQFAKQMGSDIEEMFEVKPGLEGADLRKITAMHSYFESALTPNSPEHIQSDVHEGKKIFHINVFAIEKGEIVAGVIEDITAPQVRIDKTVERARKIIDKNVSVVQQIAFLLGENAAETEAILNSIIESHTTGDAEHADDA
jgi:PAS domain-containing protein